MLTTSTKARVVIGYDLLPSDRIVRSITTPARGEISGPGTPPLEPALAWYVKRSPSASRGPRFLSRCPSTEGRVPEIGITSEFYEPRRLGPRRCRSPVTQRYAWQEVASGLFGRIDPTETA
jgi:hypothetical protein